MLPDLELQAALRDLAPAPFEGVLHRAALLEYLMNIAHTPQPLYSLGAPTSGARFTPKGGMATLYLAEHAETAYAEALQLSRTLARARPDVQVETKPIVLLSARVRVGAVLDVTEEEVQKHLGTTRSELLAAWRRRAFAGKEVPTWRLGQALFDDGRFAGLRYESSQRRGSFCFALFPDRLSGGDFIEVHDPAHNISQSLPAPP